MRAPALAALALHVLCLAQNVTRHAPDAPTPPNSPPVLIAPDIIISAQENVAQACVAQKNVTHESAGEQDTPHYLDIDMNAEPELLQDGDAAQPPPPAENATKRGDQSEGGEDAGLGPVDMDAAPGEVVYTDQETTTERENATEILPFAQKYRGIFHWTPVEPEGAAARRLAERALCDAARPGSPRVVFVYDAAKIYDFIYNVWLHRVRFLGASYARGALRVYDCCAREDAGMRPGRVIVAHQCRPMY